GCVTLPHAREGTLQHFRSGCPVWILECLKEQWDEDKNMDTAAGGLVRRGAKGSHAIEHSGNESDRQRECGIRIGGNGHFECGDDPGLDADGERHCASLQPYWLYAGD